MAFNMYSLYIVVYFETSEQRGNRVPTNKANEKVFLLFIKYLCLLFIGMKSQ